jgi:hypothetical protein
MGLLFAAMIGWCGTRWPGWFWWWWRHHWPRPPVPDPDPWPWYHDWLGGLIGAAGGVGAVIVFEPMIRDAGFLDMAMTAFFGGVFLASAVEPLFGMKQR